MKILRLSLFAAVLLLITAPHGSAQTDIPLYYEQVGNAERLVIYVGIDSGPALPYLFDTGSEVFASAYSSTNWGGATPTSTIADNAAIIYGTGGFGYQYNAVTIPSISFYSNVPSSSAVLTVTPGGTSPGFTVGQVTNRLDESASPTPIVYNGNYYTDDAAFTTAVQNNLPPNPGGLYGTFGAADFTSIVNNGTLSGTATSFVIGSVLGQSTTSGYVVSANGASPSLILGLNAAIRSQFSTVTNWTGTAANPYPTSGANASTEFGTTFNYNITDPTNPGNSISYTSTTLLDTGTQDNTLKAPGADATQVAALTDTNSKILAGDQITANPTTSTGTETYSFTTQDGSSNPVTYTADLTAAATHDTTDENTIGIGLFENDSVMFDLQNQQTGITTLVVVPEPSSFALVSGGLGLLALLVFKKRRQSKL